MTQAFAPGDDLIFQLESGFGLLRVIAVDPARDTMGQRDAGTVWHLLAYEEFFPDVESAERALAEPDALHVRNPHMALTERAFERTPAARLGNRPVTDAERVAQRNRLQQRVNVVKSVRAARPDLQRQIDLSRRMKN